MCASRSDKNRRILLIDDTEAIHADFRKILGGGANGGSTLDEVEMGLFEDASELAEATEYFQMHSAYQGREGVDCAREALQEGRPYAMAFVDIRMPPGWDGIETVTRLWEVDPYVQVVVCTAYSDYSWDEMVGKLGFSDQLLILKKPFETVEVRQLATALTEKWRLAQEVRLRLDDLGQMVSERTNELRKTNQVLQNEIATREQAEHQLRYSALHDSLTNLPNRLQLMDRLERCIERAKRQPQYGFAVLFLDLDNFKIVNDSLGHDIGDEILVETANRLVKGLRSLDSTARIDQATAARLGGDEFVIVLDGIRRAREAVLVTERVQRQLSAPFRLSEHEVTVSASIGIVLSADGYESATELLRSADTAMYRAKRGGKSRYVLFDKQMHVEAMARLKLENALRSALDKGQFELVYQPIICLGSGRIDGFEALLRWQRPGHGTVSPDVFLPMVEEIGLVGPLGSWVLQEACRQLCIWNRQLSPGGMVSLSVSVSRTQLAQPGFCADVEQILGEAGAVGGQLVLKIPQSVVIEATESTNRKLRQLKELGVHLHLDDLGRGYMPLSCLQGFPLDVVRIDRVFVRDAEAGRKCTAVIGALMMLARSLNMKVVAEGIRTRAQLDQILSLDCDYAQGCYFSKPVDATSAWALLTSEPAWLDPAAAGQDGNARGATP